MVVTLPSTLYWEGDEEEGGRRKGKGNAAIGSIFLLRLSEKEEGGKKCEGNYPALLLFWGGGRKGRGGGGRERGRGDTPCRLFG